MDLHSAQVRTSHRYQDAAGNLVVGGNARLVGINSLVACGYSGEHEVQSVGEGSLAARTMVRSR
jgi:hypothetical protein